MELSPKKLKTYQFLEGRHEQKMKNDSSYKQRYMKAKNTIIEQKKEEAK